MIPQSADILQELTFLNSRSSGPGGQNVNKVNSKVTLRWDVMHSRLLTPEQKAVAGRKLKNRLTGEGALLLTASEERSQRQNKETVLAKLDALLIAVFTPEKKRTATKPGKAAKQRRLKEKKIHGEKKQWRRGRSDD
jgi:ribosome-associated protein